MRQRLWLYSKRLYQDWSSGPLFWGQMLLLIPVIFLQALFFEAVFSHLEPLTEPEVPWPYNLYMWGSAALAWFTSLVLADLYLCLRKRRKNR